ncbi:hypothetical protein MMPV_004604 [Pyropia vietnamensis]
MVTRLATPPWLAVMYATVFLSCTSFSIVMPSLWPYLRRLGGDAAGLAALVSLYSIGEAAGALAFGAAAAAGAATRSVLMAATAVGLVGSLLYIAAQGAGGGKPAMAFAALAAGRTSQGAMTGGMQAVQQHHLGAVLPASALTPATVALNAAATVGFVAGPAVAAALATVPRVPLAGGRLGVVDSLTAPGYFVATACVATLYAYAVHFGDGAYVEPGGAAGTDAESAPLLVATAGEDGVGCKAAADPEALAVNDIEAPVAAGAAKPLLPIRSPPPPVLSPRRLRAVVVALNAVFAVHFFGFALQETVTTPLVAAYYGWGVHASAVLFTAAGGAAVVALVAAAVATDRGVPERAVLVVSVVLGVLGYSALVSPPGAPPSLVRFLVGWAAISVAFPLGRASVVAAFSHALRGRPSGGYMGVLLAVGAVSRVLGPFWAVRAFLWRWGGVAVFGCTAALFVVAGGATVAVWSSL